MSNSFDTEGSKIFRSISPSALLIMGAIVFGVLCLYAISTRGWIQNANVMHVANVAMNVASGDGYKSDAIADYLASRPANGGVRHPEDVLPLGLPTIMGLVFAVSGVSMIGVYLPALIFFIALGILTYWVGKERFGSAVGLVAAFLVWMDVNLTELALSGLSYTGFAFFFLSSVHLSERGLQEGGKLRTVGAAGLLAGLAFHMDFHASLLPVAFFIWVMFGRFKDSARKLSLRVKAYVLVVFFGVFLLTLAPWVVRNYLAFNSFGYPTWEVRTAFVALRPSKIDPAGPIIPYQHVYNEVDRPSHAKLAHDFGMYWMTVIKPKVEVHRLLRRFLSYEILAVGVLLFGLLGIFRCWDSEHSRWVQWNIMVGASSLLWLLRGAYDPVDFYVFIPLAALFCSYFLLEFGKWIRGSISRRGALLYALLLILLFGLTSLAYWRIPLKGYIPPDFSLQLKRLNKWIESNVGPDEAVISRMPHHVAWGTGRSVLATPFAGWEDFIKMRDDYGARYLVIEMPQGMAKAFENADIENYPVKQLMPLFRGDEAFGARRVFSVDDIFYVYRLPLSSREGSP